MRETSFTKEQRHLLFRQNVDFPDHLNENHIRIRGDETPLLATGRPRVVIIGSRMPTLSDIEYTNRIVEALSRNPSRPTVISGLALGTETAAHRAALACGLPTYAVLPTGLDTIYPRMNQNLADRIIENGGGLITNYPDGTAPEAPNFIQRTTLMTALADLVIVICSQEKGSPMVAARTAFDMDIPVLAVPGRPDDMMHKGTNILIKHGIANLIADYSEFETYAF